MTFKTANIQKATPAKRCSRAGDFASDLASIGLHVGQHGFDGGWDGNTERFARATLGSRESQHTIFQVYAIQRDLGLSQAAAGGQGDLKADPHPFGHTLHAESLPNDFDLILRKDRFDACDRASFNSVIEKGDGVHLSKQSALAMNPLQQLQIRTRLVASSLTARRAWEALTPSQINFTIISGKRLQGNFFLTNKSRQMTPAIHVINFCQRRNGVIFNQIIDPLVAEISALFVYTDSSSLSRCLGAVERIIDSVAGGFTAPLTRWIFRANKEPRTSPFNVRISQGIKGNIYSV